MMMVRRPEDIKSKDIHQRFKLAADDDYDVGDDGDEGGGLRIVTATNVGNI